jgi:predicted transcriptional regulator
MSARPDDALDATTVHDVLSNERRRTLLSVLADEDGPFTVRELSECVAERESGTTPAPRDLRQSVYVSLQQTHVPKLDRLGIVEFGRDGKTVTLSDNAGEVTVYLEVVPRYGLAWSEYYVGVGLLGLLVVVASVAAVPVLSEIGTAAWAIAFLGAVVLSGLYHTWTLGSTVFHRARR